MRTMQKRGCSQAGQASKDWNKAGRYNDSATEQEKEKGHGWVKNLLLIPSNGAVLNAVIAMKKVIALLPRGGEAKLANH